MIKRGLLAETQGKALATPEALNTIHIVLQQFWCAVDVSTLAQAPSLAWRVCVETAVIEVVDNCIRHAYYGIAVGSVELRLRLYADWVVARITDCGLALVSLPPPVDIDMLAVDDLPEGGYGITLARAAVDRLGYRRTTGGTNCWRLVKQLEHSITTVHAPQREA